MVAYMVGPPRWGRRPRPLRERRSGGTEAEPSVEARDRGTQVGTHGARGYCAAWRPRGPGADAESVRRPRRRARRAAGVRRRGRGPDPAVSCWSPGRRVSARPAPSRRPRSRRTGRRLGPLRRRPGRPAALAVAPRAAGAAGRGGGRGRGARRRSTCCANAAPTPRRPGSASSPRRPMRCSSRPSRDAARRRPRGPALGRRDVTAAAAPPGRRAAGVPAAGRRHLPRPGRRRAPTCWTAPFRTCCAGRRPGRCGWTRSPRTTSGRTWAAATGRARRRAGRAPAQRGQSALPAGRRPVLRSDGATVRPRARSCATSSARRWPRCRRHARPPGHRRRARRGGGRRRGWPR